MSALKKIIDDAFSFRISFRRRGDVFALPEIAKAAPSFSRFTALFLVLSVALNPVASSAKDPVRTLAQAPNERAENPPEDSIPFFYVDGTLPDGTLFSVRTVSRDYDYNTEADALAVEEATAAFLEEHPATAFLFVFDHDAKRSPNFGEGLISRITNLPGVLKRVAGKSLHVIKKKLEYLNPGPTIAENRVTVPAKKVHTVWVQVTIGTIITAGMMIAKSQLNHTELFTDEFGAYRTAGFLLADAAKNFFLGYHSDTIDRFMERYLNPDPKKPNSMLKKFALRLLFSMLQNYTMSYFLIGSPGKPLAYTWAGFLDSFGLSLSGGASSLLTATAYQSIRNFIQFGTRNKPQNEIEEAERIESGVRGDGDILKEALEPVMNRIRTDDKFFVKVLLGLNNRLFKDPKVEALAVEMRVLKSNPDKNFRNTPEFVDIRKRFEETVVELAMNRLKAEGTLGFSTFQQAYGNFIYQIQNLKAFPGSFFPSDLAIHPILVTVGTMVLDRSRIANLTLNSIINLFFNYNPDKAVALGKKMLPFNQWAQRQVENISNYGAKKKSKLTRAEMLLAVCERGMSATDPADDVARNLRRILSTKK